MGFEHILNTTREFQEVSHKITKIVLCLQMSDNQPAYY